MGTDQSVDVNLSSHHLLIGLYPCEKYYPLLSRGKQTQCGLTADGYGSAGWDQYWHCTVHLLRACQNKMHICKQVTSWWCQG